MKKYKLTAILDLGELDDLLEMVHRQIIEHSSIAGFNFLSGEISKDQYSWHKGYAEYLKGLQKKLKFERIEKKQKRNRVKKPRR